MQIRTRLCVSLDGFVTTPAGWPVQLADPAWSAEGYGFREFQDSCDAVLMGRTTFEPALGAPQWPWGELPVFVLASHTPEGTPDHVVVESDPQRLLERMRDLGDVHLVGGPTTIDTFHRLGALDLLGLIIVPVFVGDGKRLRLEATPTLQEERRLPTGAVELAYTLT
jgi:dihydrofolate reductase